MSRRLGLAALVVVPLAVLALFFAWPLYGMLSRGIWPGGHFAPGEALQVLGQPRIRRVIWFTVWSSALATAITLVLGIPAAHALYNLRFPGRGVLRAVVTVPFVLPTVVVGVAFRTLLVSSGPLGGLGLDGTAASIVAALVFFNVSVVVRTVGPAWIAIDRRPSEAASVLGASGWQVFRTVTLPMLRPVVVSAATMVFLFCVTAYGVVLTLGGLHYATVETEIYLLTTQLLDLRSAAALSILQLLMLAVLLTVTSRVRALPTSDVVVSPRRPRRGDVPAVAITVLLCGLLALPIGTLAVRSLDGPQGWTVSGFTGLGSSLGDALRTSLITALIATAVAMVLAVLISVAVAQVPRSTAERRVLRFIDAVFMLPLGVSAVTIGFGLLVTMDKLPVELRSSRVLVITAQALVALPMAVRIVVPVLRSVDDLQRQAAAILGAGRLRVFTTVDLPLVRRPLLAATGFAFAVSLGEFGATSFLVRPDQPTLPVLVYRLIGLPGVANFQMALAASVVLAAVTVAVMSVVESLRVSSVGAF